MCVCICVAVTVYFQDAPNIIATNNDKEHVTPWYHFFCYQIDVAAQNDLANFKRYLKMHFYVSPINKPISEFWFTSNFFKKIYHQVFPWNIWPMDVNNSVEKLNSFDLPQKKNNNKMVCYIFKWLFVYRFCGFFLLRKIYLNYDSWKLFILYSIHA